MPDLARELAARRLMELADVLERFQQSTDFGVADGDDSASQGSMEPDSEQRAAFGDTSAAQASEAYPRRMRGPGRMESAPNSQSSAIHGTFSGHPQLSHSKVRRAETTVAQKLRSLADQVHELSREVVQAQRQVEEEARPPRSRHSQTTSTTSHDAFGPSVRAAEIRRQRGKANPMADTYSFRLKRTSQTDLYSRAVERALTPAHEQVFALPSLKIASRLGVVL